MSLRFRFVIVIILMIIFVGAISAYAASPNTVPGNLPWTAQLFKDSEDGVSNLSTAFVGPNEIPMLSYNKAGSHNIYQAFKATSAVPGNCGPNNGWYCDSWQDSDLIPGSVSNMATINYIDTHAIRWGYSTGTHIRGVFLELMNDMTFVDADWVDLVQLSKLGGSLVGTPSIAIDSGGHYEMALTILGGGDLYPYSLVYMTYVGGSNTSCSSVASGYECVVIDTSFGYGSMASPSLSMSDDGAVGIAYYKSGEMMYAYPHASIPGWPSNCGTVGNPWRCISIFSGTPTGTVGSIAKLAFGAVSNQLGIAFTYDDELIPVTLFNATYVGSDGNCGWDARFGGFSDYRWQCDSLVYFYYQNSSSYSIDIDPEGYPVIAYNFAADDLANLDLYIVYPNARIGDPADGWTAQHIDGAPVYDVETGALAAISINSSGMGLISYLQEEAYEIDDLKIAFQLYRASLPIVTKP